MAEYWQDIERRAQATAAVWQAHFAGLALGTTDAAAFVAMTEDLPGLAQARDDAAQVLDGARQARDLASRAIRGVCLRVPKIIEGRLDPGSGAADDLDKVYAIRPRTFDTAVARGRALLPVWRAADAWLAAQAPTQTAIVCGTLDADGFGAALENFGPRMQAVADAELGHDSGRDDLRGAARGVELLCIRFLKAAKGISEPDTPARAALDTIPRRTRNHLPRTLRITAFTQGGAGGLELTAAYAPYELKPDETAALQYRRTDIDADWLSVPYDPGGNAIGPFAAGQTVRARTRVTNPRGSREGGVRQLTLIAPADG